MKRTHFLVASASLAAVAGGTAAAANVPGGTDLVEKKANFNEAAFKATLGRPAQIRQLFEQVKFDPTLLGNIKNAMNGLAFGFGYPRTQIAMALAGHGPSAVYGYSDYVWEKYKIGEFFKIKDAKGDAITSNVWLKPKSALDWSASPDDEKGAYQDTSLETLQKRGLTIMTCHTAVEEQSRKLVAAGNAPAGMTGSDVAADILTHLIPGAVVVPSMVATVAVLQQNYHYTYAALTF